MGGLLIKLRTWWESADKNQRLITVGGAAFLSLLFVGVFVYATKPKMAIAFAGLNPADTGMVASEIQAMGLPVEYDSAGTVSVPADKIAQVKATLAMNGKLPKSTNHLTKNDLKDMSFMAPPHVEDARLLAITEGQLAESIEMFAGVAGAQVHVAKGNDSPLLDRSREASANVTINEKVGSSVTPDQGRAMAMLVASSVEGLTADKVTIFSSEGRAIWDGQETSGTTGRANNKLEMERSYARNIRDDLQEQLNRIVGTGNALASVDVTLDLDKVSQTENTTAATEDPITKSTVKESMGSAGGATPGGPTGLATNGGGAAPTSSPTADGGYKVNQENAQYGTSTVVKSIDKAPGEIKSIGITILVNNEKVDADGVKKIQEMADAKLGPKIADPANFVAKVIDYKFDNSAQVAAAKATETAGSSARMQQILSMLPIFALIVVAFFVMKTLGKLGKNAQLSLGGHQLAFAGAGGAMMPGGSGNVAALAAHSLSIPEEAVRQALESGVVDEELASALAEAQKHTGVDQVDIPSIGNKINVPLEQIKKMSNEKPEVVAMLIKSWLLEEGIRR